MNTPESDREDLASMLRLFVADTLSNDIEQLGQIVSDLNNGEDFRYRDYWAKEFLRDEVLEALCKLVDLGHVCVLDGRRTEQKRVDLSAESPSVAELWFGLTDAGREVWSHWSFPTGRV